jgi:hypothetical protein
MELEFPQQIFEKTQISNFIKIRPMEDELSQCGCTDGHHEAKSRFSKFYAHA